MKHNVVYIYFLIYFFWRGYVLFGSLLPQVYCCSVAKSCPTLFNPMDCSTSDFSVSIISWSLLKFMSIESVMLSNHLIPCCPLLLLPSIFPSIRILGFPGGSDGKASVYNMGDPVRSLGWEDPLDKEITIHSSTIAWKIPWTEEPGRLQSMGSQRVRHD